jgi:hypothetical protein
MIVRSVYKSNDEKEIIIEGCEESLKIKNNK